MNTMRIIIITTIAGVAGCIITLTLGGWDTILQALFAVMATDYLSGWIVAIVFKGSRKTRSGAFNTRAAIKGLAKKVVSLLLVVAGHFIDGALGTTFLRDTIIFALIANELMSLLENVALTGVRVPKVLKKALDILHESGGHERWPHKNVSNGRLPHTQTPQSTYNNIKARRDTNADNTTPKPKPQHRQAKPGA